RSFVFGHTKVVESTRPSIGVPTEKSGQGRGAAVTWLVRRRRTVGTQEPAGAVQKRTPNGRSDRNLAHWDCGGRPHPTTTRRAGRMDGRGRRLPFSGPVRAAVGAARSVRALLGAACALAELCTLLAAPGTGAAAPSVDEVVLNVRGAAGVRPEAMRFRQDITL